MPTFETGQGICDAEGRLTVRKGAADVPVDVLISTALIKDKDIDRVLVTLIDITERKRAQDELSNRVRCSSQSWTTFRSGFFGRIETRSLSAATNLSLWIAAMKSRVSL